MEDGQKKVMDPVALASSFEPLKRASMREETNLYSGTAVKRSERLQGPQTSNLDVTAVAPYQAMPVHGPLITHNKASGLEVVENGDGALSAQVSWPGLAGRCYAYEILKIPPIDVVADVLYFRRTGSLQ